MPELGVMKTKNDSDSTKKEFLQISPLCQFVLSNKRYCYYIMRHPDNEGYLINFIKYFYFGKSLPATPSNQYQYIHDFPDLTVNHSLFYINDNINTVTELIKSVEDNIKEQKILIITLKTPPGKQENIPRILSEHYVLLSCMITSANKQTIETESIPENDPSEYALITVTNGSQIMLNYQYMLFPPKITKGLGFTKLQGRSRPEHGGKKTIRKYRKHNRNKTTRNYK